MIQTRLLFFLLSMWVISAHSTPRIPSADNEILETLPSRLDPRQQELARFRAALIRAPTNQLIATQLAQRYISASRVDGDPRYLGYAQAALRPWWNLNPPPESVLLLRATIFQSIHQFPQALADLNTVLHADKSNGQAWLTRATVLTVVGDYAQAKENCDRLAGLAANIITQTCRANIGSLNGQAETSYRALEQALHHQTGSDPAIEVWIRTLMGEMAARLDRDAEADAHFQAAMRIGQPDGYLLGAYADFLLAKRRYSEIVRLLKEKTKNDALLLRYALALKLMKSPLAAAQIDTLRARFSAAAMRGDTVHQREQSRFELHILETPTAALATAQKNWAVQKEPADLHVLAEAAVATRDQAAAHQVRTWIAQTGFEDRTLAPLIAQLDSAK